MDREAVVCSRIGELEACVGSRDVLGFTLRAVTMPHPSDESEARIQRAIYGPRIDSGLSLSANSDWVAF